MAPKIKFSKLSIVLLFLGMQPISYGQDIWDQTQNMGSIISNNRQDWFNNLEQNIINKIPEVGSDIAEWDRVLSNEYQATTGSRLDLANADKSQDANYLYNSFMDKIFGQEVAGNIGNLKSDWYFETLEYHYKQATYARDDQANRTRSIDFILKDRFKRGRPYQVLDANGNYKPNYTSITGSSFPSGHTWNGFRQAVTLAMVFPEIGGEIFARAIEYGESRVIVGAHFATDTIASRVGNYHTMAQMLADDDIADTVVALAKGTRETVAQACNMDVRSCIEQNSTSLTLNNDNSTGSYGKKDSNIAPLIKPEDIPDVGAYLLRLRFPYLDESQWKMILASTAYPSNSLAGWNIEEGDPDTYWGLINLPDAYNGPSHFYEDFLVNQDSQNARFDMAGFTAWDTWKNSINGDGRLIKYGDGTLHLAGNDTFGGLEINGGNIIVSGDSHYSELSNVNKGGTLVLSGLIGSDIVINGGILDLIDGVAHAQVSANGEGKIIGNGTIGTLILENGGIISPGHSIGTVIIDQQLTFEKGSQFLVEINPENGTSDQIINHGNTTINGGSILVSLEDKDNLLTKEDVHSLLGSEFTIMQTDGIQSGKFDAVIPNYLFVGAIATYNPNSVMLGINRNDTSFASLGTTYNQREIANAIDHLPAGNAVYESFLKMDNVEQARVAFNALTGQVHADMMATQIDASNSVRDAMGRRFNELKSNSNVWVDLVGNWNNVSSDDNAYKYKSTNYGVLLGADALIGESGWLVGILGGYTHTSLTSHNADGKSDNFHLGIYGSKSINNFNLRAGIAHSWHSIDTTRNVAYGNQFDTNKAKYDATTRQIFAEVGYQKDIQHWQLEPFFNLAHIYYQNDRFLESGGAAALNGRKQHLSTTLSVLGLRVATTFNVGTAQTILTGEMGWQHQFNGVDRDIELTFRGANTPFSSRSVTAAKNSFILKLNMDFVPNKNSKISIGYDGRFGKDHTDNSVNAKFTYNF